MMLCRGSGSSCLLFDLLCEEKRNEGSKAIVRTFKCVSVCASVMSGTSRLLARFGYEESGGRGRLTPPVTNGMPGIFCFIFLLSQTPFASACFAGRGKWDDDTASDHDEESISRLSLSSILSPAVAPPLVTINTQFILLMAAGLSF